MQSHGGSTIIRLIALALIVCACAGCRKPSQPRKRPDAGKQNPSSERGDGTNSGGQGRKPGGQGQGSGQGSGAQGSGGSQGSPGAPPGSSSGSGPSGNGSSSGQGGNGGGKGQPGGGVSGGQSSQGRRPSSGGDSSDSDTIGVVAPKSSAEAAEAAQAELMKSQAALERGDLPGAYRHAALALQSAEYFPDDPACSRLALSAQAQLQELEKKGLSREELQKKGDVQGKRIVETP